MTETLKSINLTHPRLPNLTLRIGVYTPDAIGRSAKDPEDRRCVLEFHVRNDRGASEMIGSLTLDDFTDYAREAVRIGKSVLPESDNGQEV